MSELILRPQPGKQELMLNVEADVILVGGAAGSAKSYTLLMRLLRYVEDPKFNAIFFRKTTGQLSGAGGLWDTAKQMYSPWNPRVREKDYKITFPSGSFAKFSHMEHSKNRFDHQGLQYSVILWDELTHFEEVEFTYLLSRLRSESDVKSFTMASMNPDPDSWVLKYVDWYLDEEGYPDPSKCGVIRYFIIKDGSPIFSDSREQLIEDYPENCFVINPITGVRVSTPPKSLCFIGATIFDNPKLIEANPNYLSELQALPEVERARLLHGNWKVRPQGSNYFDRKWLVKVDKLPFHTTCARGFDKASAEPSEVNRYVDYTASVKMHKCRDGYYYIVGNYHPEFKDEDSEILGRIRRRPGERDQLILKQALYDGAECQVVLPIDPGGAGKTEYLESAKKLIAQGIKTRADPMPSNKSKLTRFEPFSSACQNGLVRIVESTFPNKATLEHFYKELESFNGERSTAHRKDDIPDAAASVFNFLAKSRVYKTPHYETLKSSDSLATELLSGYSSKTVADLPKTINNI